MARTKAKARKGEAGRVYREARNLGQSAKESRELSKNVLSKEKKRRLQEVEESTDSPESQNTLPEWGSSHHPNKRAKPNDLSVNVVSVETLHAQQAITTKDPFTSSLANERGSDAALGLIDDLSATYKVVTMNIISSSHIQQKVTRVLETLASFSFAAPAQPNIVLLHAKSHVASKMITVVDIAKREIAQAGGKWYQYNCLGEIVETRKKTMAGSGDDVGTILGHTVDANSMEVDKHEWNEDGAAENGASFETMKTPLERALDGRPKVHAVPVMTIYLSRVRIEKLKNTYG